MMSDNNINNLLYYIAVNTKNLNYDDSAKITENEFWICKMSSLTRLEV